MTTPKQPTDRPGEERCARCGVSSSNKVSCPLMIAGADCYVVTPATPASPEPPSEYREKVYERYKPSQEPEREGVAEWPVNLDDRCNAALTNDGPTRYCSLPQGHMLRSHVFNRVEPVIRQPSPKPARNEVTQEPQAKSTPERISGDKSEPPSNEAPCEHTTPIRYGNPFMVQRFCVSFGCGNPPVERSTYRAGSMYCERDDCTRDWRNISWPPPPASTPERISDEQLAEMIADHRMRIAASRHYGADTQWQRDRLAALTELQQRREADRQLGGNPHVMPYGVKCCNKCSGQRFWNGTDNDTLCTCFTDCTDKYREALKLMNEGI